MTLPLTLVCSLCSQPVVASSDGGLWLSVDTTGERTYCRPENMPGGVADDRVFPLHTVTRKEYRNAIDPRQR